MTAWACLTGIVAAMKAAVEAINSAMEEVIGQQATGHLEHYDAS